MSFKKPLTNSHWILTFFLMFLATGSAQSQVEEASPFYKIKAKDTVGVVVFNESDMGISQMLDVDASIVLPILGRVVLGGMTLQEAEAFLEKKYIEEEILVKPEVSVSIVAYAPETFYVYGEVANPGAKTFPSGKQSLDILEAITMAGDLTQYAKKRDITIKRTDPKTGKVEDIKIDLDRILSGKSDQKVSAYKVKPGDILVVPERFM